MYSGVLQKGQAPNSPRRFGRVGLDVFEDEPAMKPGLAECENAVIVPHIASASLWTRSGMVCCPLH